MLLLAVSTICTISKQIQVHFTYIHNFLHKLERTFSYILSAGEGRGEAWSLVLYVPLFFFLLSRSFQQFNPLLNSFEF